MRAATNSAIYQTILQITFVQLLFLDMQGEGVMRILMYQVSIFQLCISFP